LGACKEQQYISGFANSFLLPEFLDAMNIYSCSNTVDCGFWLLPNESNIRFAKDHNSSSRTPKLITDDIPEVATNQKSNSTIGRRKNV
jgi:hypothetical protein